MIWKISQANHELLSINSAWPAMDMCDPDFRRGTGAGSRVCLLDSGVDPSHPMVGRIDGAYAVIPGVEGDWEVTPVHGEDTSGHGTACAGIIRSVAPDCELVSVKVLNGTNGKGGALLTGLQWAVDQKFNVINLSLSTSKAQFSEALREICDDAYFSSILIVSAAHNMPIESYPWRYSSTISVGSHADPDPGAIYYNPAPPVEFFAHGEDVTVAWTGGETRKRSGNSFAAAHVTGICALVLAQYPNLTPFQMKSLLYLAAKNVKTYK
ncbi:S8 family serine peptidase [Streptomyces chartreusis]|uniref:S8 family serine peptidase n=1 Tax=Streptomyces chartreusis TaxID=1969 RepID=UPI0037FDD5CA